MEFQRVVSRVRELLRTRPVPAPASAAAPPPPPDVVAVVHELIKVAERQMAFEALPTVGFARLKSSPSSWNSSNNRNACLADLFPGKVVGEGAFGTVFRLGDFAKKPKKKKNNNDLAGWAAKTMSLTSSPWDPMPSMEKEIKKWKREAEAAVLAGKLGVGPKVHDAFVCVAEDEPKGVIVMDYIEGVKLSVWRTQASPEDAARAMELAKQKAETLHAVAMQHGDLHAGNVIVVPVDAKKGTGVRDVFILDYGFTRSCADVQRDDLLDLEELTDGRRPQTPAQERASHIAAALLAEGTITL